MTKLYKIYEITVKTLCKDNMLSLDSTDLICWIGNI